MNPRILVVDDNETYLSLVCEELAELGHPIETASNGEQAGLKISSRRYGAVLMDHLLDGDNAIAVLRRLTSEATRGVKIVIMTALPTDSPQWKQAHKDLGDLKSARPEFGPVQLLSKPQQLSQMRKILDDLLRSN